MPDGALLMVSKRLAQPQQIWNQVRVAAWDTSQPHEDRLDVDVGPNQENFGEINWTSQGDGYDLNDQLLMDPGGNYLVVRLSPDAFSWNVNPGESAKAPRSVLNIIDLRAFKLLRRVELADPLLAGGDMGFSPKGTFMVSGFQEHSSTKNPLRAAVTDARRYVVETLTLPGLEAKTVCNYAMVEKTYAQPVPITTPLATEESARIEEEYGNKNSEEMDRRQKQRDAADAQHVARPALALGFSSLNDVHESLNLDGRLKGNLDYTMRVPEQSPWGCSINDLSGNLQYEMFDCDESRVVVFGSYRAFRVFRLEDGKQIMELKLPHPNRLKQIMEIALPHWLTRWFSDALPIFSGVLATSRGVTYVVLLRDGVELRGYRVP